MKIAGIRSVGVHAEMRNGVRAACARHPFAPEVIHTRGAVLDGGTIVDW